MEEENKNFVDKVIEENLTKLKQEIRKQKSKRQSGLVQKVGKILKTEIPLDPVKTFGRYTLTSFLPKKLQKEVAEKHNENVQNYLTSTIWSEIIMGWTMVLAGGAICPPIAIAGSCIVVDGGINALRSLCYMATKKTCGHPITTIPYHAVKQPYNLVKNRLSKRENKVKVKE